MFDLDAIDSQDIYHLSPEARERFITLYNSIPVDNDASQEEHVAAVTQAWKDRDIQVEGSGISLVEVYLHSPFDSLRFVGHVGILLETDDGLLFVEKFGPEEPFQATKFQDRGQAQRLSSGPAGSLWRQNGTTAHPSGERRASDPLPLNRPTAPAGRTAAHEKSDREPFQRFPVTFFSAYLRSSTHR